MLKRIFLILLVFVCFCGVVFGESVSVDRARRVGVRQRNRSNFQRFHSMENSGTIEKFSEYFYILRCEWGNGEGIDTYQLDIPHR